MQNTAEAWNRLHNTRKHFKFIHRLMFDTSYLQYPADVPLVVYSSHILRNISQSTLFTATVMWDITWCKSCRITSTVPTMIFQQDDAPPHYIQRSVLVLTHCFLANGLDMRDMLHNPVPHIRHVEILVSVDLCGMWLCLPMPTSLCGLQ